MAPVKPETGTEWGARRGVCFLPTPHFKHWGLSSIFHWLLKENISDARSSGAQDWCLSFRMTSCPVTNFCPPVLPLTSFWFWVLVFQHPLLPFPLFPTSYFMFPAMSFFLFFSISEFRSPCGLLSAESGLRAQEDRKDTAAQLSLTSFYLKFVFCFETAAPTDRAGFGKGTDPSRPV